MLDYIKTFCQIPQSVTIYDDNLMLQRSIALKRLEIAGIEQDETSPVVRDYIASYCRLQIVTEPTANFVDFEEKRLQTLLELMTYGGI